MKTISLGVSLWLIPALGRQAPESFAPSRAISVPGALDPPGNHFLLFCHVELLSNFSVFVPSLPL